MGKAVVFCKRKIFLSQIGVSAKKERDHQKPVYINTTK